MERYVERDKLDETKTGFTAETFYDAVNKVDNLRISYFKKGEYCGDIIFNENELFEIVNDMLPSGERLQITYG